MAKFNEEAFSDKKTTTINMRDMFKITATTRTPLTQMNSNGKQRHRYVFSGDVSFKVPFFSASGFRGIMRRIATLDMYHHILEKDKDFSMSEEEFYLYVSGSAVDKKSIERVTWMTEEKVRLLAPVLSLWGGGLSAISGKLAMCDLTPSREELRTFTDDKGKERGVSLIDEQVFFRGDDLLKASFTQVMVDKDSVEAWLKENKEKVVASKEKVAKAKEAGSKDKKETKNDAVNIQMPVDVDSILPNVKLVSSINSIAGKELTDVEKGLVLKSLIELSKVQIGANVRYGYGVLDWNVELEGETAFTSIADPDYVFEREVVVSDKAQVLITAYEKWAKENYTTNIDIDSLLVR